MSARAAPGPGAVLGGYVIESLLGRGGMGAVYLATHSRLGRKVALKLIAPEFADDEAFRARFLRESRLAASLDHPNVIPIHDAGEDEGVLYLAMRYVAGPSLQALVRERGPLPAEEMLRVAGQIAGALDAAHAAGLVHRDVKPANVLLAEPGGHAYLTDFGLAKRPGASRVTRTGSFVGTAEFSSPEQIEGRELDGRADVYSLGCVVFDCLAGRPPFRAESEIAVLHAHLHEPPPSLTALRPELPRAVDAVVAAALAKDPAARYPTGRALVAALAEALAGETVAAGEETTRVMAPARRASSGGRSGRRWWVAAAAAAAVAAAAVALVVLTTRSSPGGAPDADVATFVARVENILVQSSAGRREIAAAIAAARRCAISPREAGRRIGSVGANRQSVVQQLGALATPTPQASRLAALLQQALQASSEADRHYRDAFAALGKPRPGCAIPPSRDFRLAAKADARASAAKRRFVARFDPLARRLGRRTWSAAQF